MTDLSAPAVQEDRTDLRVPASFDASVWADEWCRIASEIEAAKDGRKVIDDGWMISWFANALMRGYDEGRGKDDTEIASLRVQVSVLQAGLLRHLRNINVVYSVLKRKSQPSADELAQIAMLSNWGADLAALLTEPQP